MKNVKQGNTDLANYFYLSDGTKFSATDAAGNGLVYVGSLVYKKQGASLSVESIPFSRGRIVKTTTGFEPHYFITDHLGSVRAIVNKDKTVLECSDYYPYGMRWNAGQLSPENRYRYNGKEEQNFLNVPYNDHGARMVDTRFRLSWGGIDPLSEMSRRTGSYVFCLNNPIRHMDPDGRIPVETIWDAVNVVDGVRSLINNISEGNVGGAVVDGLGIVVDAFATAFPYIPGGVHTAITSVRAAKALDKAIDAAKVVDNVSGAAKTADKASDAAQAGEKTFQTYTKTHPDGRVYSGRTSGKGSPEKNVQRRDRNHHKNKDGFGPAKTDRTSSNPDAIRGREQQLIEQNGGATVQGGTSGNTINGVSPKNPQRETYEEARKRILNL